MPVASIAISVSATVRLESVKLCQLATTLTGTVSRLCPRFGKADDEQLAALAGSDTVLYTPEIVNSPNVVANAAKHLCASLRSIKQEPQRRAEKSTPER